MTFSIAARCVRTQMFGMAIASSSTAVAARCAHARAGAGAAGTQNITDPSLGPRILDSLARGSSADDALQSALQSTAFGAYRQLVVVGGKGPPAIHSGAHALGLVGSAIGGHSAGAGRCSRGDGGCIRGCRRSFGRTFAAGLARGRRAGRRGGAGTFGGAAGGAPGGLGQRLLTN